MPEVKDEAKPTAAFPSLEWFIHLATLMDQRRSRHEQIGPVDCVAQFTIIDADGRGNDRSFQVTFDLYSAVEVREVGPSEVDRADFMMETDLLVWQEMIENIRDNGGRPDLEHSLNRLSLPGVPIRVWSSDPLRRDMFFRFNQSIQEYVNASAEVATTYPDIGD